MATQKQQPRYKQIYDDLLDKIQTGQYMHGSFLPPERVLSALYKVERPTLRQALKLLEKDNYLEKIQGAGNRITWLGTHTINQNDHYARTIVYVLPDSIGERGPQPYHDEVCEKLGQLCSKHNYGLILTKARAMGDNMPQWMYSRSVIGAIWVSGINEPLLQAAKMFGIPSLLSSNDNDLFPRVNVDDIAAGYLATRHLIERGCRNIVHITGMNDYPTSRARVHGYRNALLEAGLPFNRDNIYSGDWCYQTGLEIASSILKIDTTIDGIFTSNDMMAFGVIDAAKKLGISVPSALKVIGVDNILESKSYKPALSTISFSKEDVAKCMFTSLYAILHGLPIPQEVLMPAKLIAREST